MLDRYSSNEMAAVFSDQQRFERWREVELAVLAGYAQAGVVDQAVVDAAAQVPCPSADVVKKRELQTGHDVVAFLLEWTSGMPSDVSCRVHRGLTSSDVVDTALALALREASELILGRLDQLLAVLVDHALVHRDTARIGRTHGQHATAEVWGHRVADFAFAVDRARQRLERAQRGLLLAKLSGTTGTYQQVPVEVEAAAAALLGLAPVEVATQVVMRDRLAEWMFALAAISAVCEAIAMEVRLGQRSEVAELAEAASGSRSGSSSMPHKANPITSEKIDGLARLVRAYVNPVLEGVTLWHERDLTHSSVERIAIPDAAALTEHVVAAMTSVMATLVVDVEQMRTRAASTAVPTLTNAALVRLGDAGLPWAQAWAIVQHVAKQDPTADAQALVAGLAAAVATEAPEIGSGWVDGLNQPVPVRLETVFDRLQALPSGSA